jgi:uncharacterized protein YcgI (DUF1989 family)
MDVIVVMSACPQDVTPINGTDCTPRDIQYAVTLASIKLWTRTYESTT